MWEKKYKIDSKLADRLCDAEEAKIVGGLKLNSGVIMPLISKRIRDRVGSFVVIGADFRYLPFDFPVFHVSVTSAVFPGGIVLRETLLTVHLQEGLPGTIFKSAEPSLRSTKV